MWVYCRETIPSENTSLLSENTPVINISATILTSDQVNVLSRGLNYSPTKNFNLYNTLLDVNKFVRNLTLRRHFFNEPAIQNYDKTPSVHHNFTSFEDQRVISTLRSLQDDGLQGEGAPQRTYTFTGNKNFYPIQSRTASMDIYQDLVEKELTLLQSRLKKQGILMLVERRN